MEIDLARSGAGYPGAMSAAVEIVYERGGLSDATFRALWMTAICGR
jgi:hypothetical protein